MCKTYNGVSFFDEGVIATNVDVVVVAVVVVAVDGTCKKSNAGKGKNSIIKKKKEIMKRNKRLEKKKLQFFKFHLRFQDACCKGAIQIILDSFLLF